MDMDQYKN